MNRSSPALREHRAAAVPLIAQQGGRIVKTTGDGLLIEFGSLVGAVECALALAQRRATALNSLENTIGHEEARFKSECTD